MEIDVKLESIDKDITIEDALIEIRIEREIGAPPMILDSNGNNLYEYS